MNGQRKLLLFIILPALFIFIFLLSSLPNTALAQTASPTPTYDPIAQPPLPPNPTEYELGRYLFWQHCMPCHGDRGQGLTDEFRAVWVEDHQNCWARGCHSGKWPEEDSFPVPTMVPAVVNEDRLSRFASQQDLFDYLKATHPPQYPGFLQDDEYRALAFFVFTMNDRLPADPTPQPTITPTPNLPPPSKATQPPGLVPLIALGVILLVILFRLLLPTRLFHRHENIRGRDQAD